MQRSSGRQNRAGQLMMAVIVCLIAMVGAMWMHGDIGILQQGMVAGEARRDAALPTDWPLAEASGDGLTTLLFYAPERQAFTARVYERRTGMEGFYFKLGWFQSYDWALDAAAVSADQPQATVWYAPLTVRDTRPYFSLNAAHAAEARTPDGALFMELDPDAPFAVQGPEGLVFCDAEGNEVPCQMAPDSDAG